MPRSPNDKFEATPRVLRWDASGVVEAAGPDATLFKAGDEVCYAGEISRSGSNAEFQPVDGRIAGFKPKGLSFVEAAALQLTTITAWTFCDRLDIARYGACNGHPRAALQASVAEAALDAELSRKELSIIVDKYQSVYKIDLSV